VQPWQVDQLALFPRQISGREKCSSIPLVMVVAYCANNLPGDLNDTRLPLKAIRATTREYEFGYHEVEDSARKLQLGDIWSVA
jgi:hypothetical protein